MRESPLPCKERGPNETLEGLCTPWRAGCRTISSTKDRRGRRRIIEPSGVGGKELLCSLLRWKMILRPPQTSERIWTRSRGQAGPHVTPRESSPLLGIDFGHTLAHLNRGGSSDFVSNFAGMRPGGSWAFVSNSLTGEYLTFG